MPESPDNPAASPRPPRVFLSYSHDSPEHMDRVLALADRLRAEGVDAQLDQYEPAPVQGWPRWMEDSLERADFVVVVCTETYHRRFRGREEQGQGLGVSWEGAILVQELYEAGGGNERFIPVVLEPDDLAYIPLLLRSTTRYDLSQEEGYEELYRRLTSQPKMPKGELGKIRPLPPRERSRDLIQSQALKQAYRRRAELASLGQDDTAVVEEILDLKRRLREGGRLKAGDVFGDGRYELIEVVGRGGFATVWKAYDEKLTRLVAVKVLHGQYSEDRTLRERFFRGARKMAQVRHPNIVEVLEGEAQDGGFHYFVMEYLAGGDLRLAVISKRLGPHEALAKVLEVGEALDFAHRRGLIHRDIKPANILLNGDGRPKLTDFDLVRGLDTTGGTRTAAPLGTFLYSAPEGLANAKEAAVAADVYSLGMTVVFALHGKELPLDVLRRGGEFIDELHCPPDVKRALVRATSWKPEERFATVGELVEALEAGEARMEAAPELASGRVLPRGQGRRPASTWGEETPTVATPPSNLPRKGEGAPPPEERFSSVLPSWLILALARWKKRRAREKTTRRVISSQLDKAANQLPAARASQRRAEGSLVEAGVPVLPPLNLLQLEDDPQATDPEQVVGLEEVIRKRFAMLGVEGTLEGGRRGPVVTVYEFEPARKLERGKLVRLEEDLASSLHTGLVRIGRIPGRSTLGIEVPNQERSTLLLGPLLANYQFQSSWSPLTLALGKTLEGKPYYSDLTTMPHLLVAGSPGAGKSTALQSMITSILYKATKDEVKFIFIDPKRIELGVYRDIPHLATEVVVDPKQATHALMNLVAEMERRYRLLAEAHVRSIAYYNRVIDRAVQDPEVRRRLDLSEEQSEFLSENLKPLPYYVIVVDELADLMMVASSEVETSIARLAQMARAVGIHLIIATQHLSADVLTETIKANFPCRIAFATASRHDSRAILDQVGAEMLLGKGDMLLMPPGSSRIQRLHGGYVSEQETAALVRWLKRQGPPEYDPELLEAPEEETGGTGDEFYDEAVRLVVSEGMGSASFLQRRLRVGFSRASRLLDLMERDGILGPAEGSKQREVLVKPDSFE